MPQTPPLLTRGEWVAACSTCTRLFDALVRGSFEPDSYPVAEFMELSGHLASDHLGLLPPYKDGCNECLEWQAHDPDSVAVMQVGDTIPGPRLVPLLGRQDLLHRAGHLIYADL
jgi:hypothetical protein